MKLSKYLFTLLLIACFSLVLSQLFFISIAHAEQVWKIRSEGVEKLGSEDKTFYRFERGYLDSTSSNFKNGIIEFELKPTQERAFFYVYFRKQSAKESEQIYIRTHKSNAPDTIQYSPVYQGKSAWQLYHGEYGTATATLPTNDWVKVKLQVIGNKLTMWVGDNTEPNIKDMILRRSDEAGSISFRSFIPRGSAAKHAASLRNISVQHLPSSGTLIENNAEDNLSFVSAYKVSPAFEVLTKSSRQIPQEILEQEWNFVKTNAQGVLELLPNRTIPDGIRTWAVAADLTLEANTPTQCQIDLGFSDAINLILNGKPIFFADASYRYNTNRQEGLLHSKQISIFLALKAGQNDLRAIVADSFGGWGLQAQLIDCENVKAT